MIGDDICVNIQAQTANYGLMMAGYQISVIRYPEAREEISGDSCDERQSGDSIRPKKHPASLEGRISMPLPLRILFVAFSIVFTSIGLLMMVAPARCPKLYEGFLRQSVMQREKTEAGELLAIRAQGLIAASIGIFFGFFVWAMR